MCSFIISQRSLLLVLSPVTLFFFSLMMPVVRVFFEFKTIAYYMILKWHAYYSLIKTQHLHDLPLFPLCALFLISLFLPAFPPSLPSPTVFLSVSCLESQPAGQPRARKFVSSSAVEREATCSGGSAASALTWGLFLTVDPRLLFQARPLQRDDRPGNMRGAEGCSFLCDTRIWWRLLV